MPFIAIILAGSNAQTSVNRQQQSAQDVTTVETDSGNFNQGQARQSGGIKRYFYSIRFHNRKEHVFTHF